MQQSALEMAKELVEALIQAGRLTPQDMHRALQESHASLMALQARGAEVEGGDVPMRGRPPVSMDWRQSITRHAITCLECGAVYKQLSIRHLRDHDLNARSYRTKYGIPRTQALAARDTTARRRQAVQETRPWEKTPRYLETQTKEATAAKRKKAAAKRRS